MNSLVLNQDIKSMSDFRSNVSGFINQVHTTKRPIVITQHGKSSAVLIDVAEYQSMLDQLELLKEVNTAENQISEGHYLSNEDVTKRLNARYNK